jgi:hypothetical protein
VPGRLLPLNQRLALDTDVNEQQNRREGKALLDAMGRAGVTGQGWHSGGDLMGGGDR